MPDTRNDPEAAYRAFMSMGADEWLGLLASLRHGTLRPAEQEGFDRALRDRMSFRVPEELTRTSYIEYRIEFRGRGLIEWVASQTPTRLEHDEMLEVLGRAEKLVADRNGPNRPYDWRVVWRVVAVDEWKVLEPGTLETAVRYKEWEMEA